MTAGNLQVLSALGYPTLPSQQTRYVAEQTGYAASSKSHVDGIAANLRMAKELQEVHEQHDAARPANTRKQYTRRIEEFRAWCRAQKFPPLTCDKVDGEKLAYFIWSYVRTKKRERARRSTSDHSKAMSLPIMEVPLHLEGADAHSNSLDSAARGPPSAGPTDYEHDPGAPLDSLGKASVNAYIAAVVDLWRQQRQAGVNDADHPRNGPIKVIIKTLCLHEKEKRKSEYRDRGDGTYLDGISTKGQIARLVNDGFERNTHEGIRDRAMHLISNFALLRGENVRSAELADFHPLELDESVHSRCLSVIMTMRNGKTNQDGRLEMMGLLRNKDFELCPVGALAFHLFCRFHCYVRGV